MKTFSPKSGAQTASKTSSFFGKREGQGFFSLAGPAVAGSRGDGAFFRGGSRGDSPDGSAGGCIQAKLSVGQPGDVYEREADSMADSVVRSEGPIRTKAGGIGPMLQRQPGVLPQFSVNNFIKNFANFNAQYAVTGPVPATGTLFITHHVFFDFPGTMTKAERTTFETDFVKSVHDGWSNKHLLKLNEPGFSPYQCNVDVTADPEEKATDAHTVIHVIKPGDKAKRFRPRVTGPVSKPGSITTHEAKLDFRDPTELLDTKLNESDFLLDVGNFDFDSADLNSDCQDAIKKIKAFIATIPPSKDPNDPCTFSLKYTGRASSEGSFAYNKALSQRRIDSVDKELGGLPGFCLSISTAAGKVEATTDPSFRRVSVGVFLVGSSKPTKDKQNEAAHEFGHMIGLGDEYVEEKPDIPGTKAKFFGDKPTHYDDVKNIVGQDAADELKIQDSGNIMSKGMAVKRGHYVYFVAALDVMTDPEIEAATGKKDVKWSVV